MTFNGINESTKVTNIRSIVIESGPEGLRRHSGTTLRLEPTAKNTQRWAVMPALRVENACTAESLAWTGCYVRVRFDQGGDEWERTTRDQVAIRVAQEHHAATNN